MQTMNYVYTIDGKPATAEEVDEVDEFYAKECGLIAFMGRRISAYIGHRTTQDMRLGHKDATI